jgi:hypothetical protein|tara:strand:- start:27 stop:467 length:441 start_codon:yes stop_codon:yes gene_type:complete
MAKKKGRSRRRNTFSVLNALEAYVYATILTEGVAGTSPIGMITGATDLQRTTTTSSLGMGTFGRDMQTLSTSVTGNQAISLGDIATEPGLAFSTMAMNFQQNLVPMAFAAFGTSFTFRIGKRLLRRPISNVNKNLIKPALGAGIRL